MLYPDFKPSVADSLDGRLLTAAMHRGASVSIPSHSQDIGQLVGSWRGLFTMGTEVGQWVMPAAHAVWIPPNHIHSGRTHGPFDGWTANVAPSACSDLPDRPVALRISGLLREAVLRIAELKKKPIDETYLALTQIILSEVRTLPVENLGLPMPRDARLAKITNALADAPADDRDLNAWASWAGMSARTLSRRFVSETGFTFTEWRQRARMLRALGMLAEGAAVTTVALDLGYSSISAFIALFRKTFGATPGEYMRNAVKSQSNAN
jgi:AraC-like DNA-binding protein